MSDSRRSYLSGTQGHLGVLGPAELGELVQDLRELVGQRGVLPAELVLDQGKRHSVWRQAVFTDTGWISTNVIKETSSIILP